MVRQEKISFLRPACILSQACATIRQRPASAMSVAGRSFSRIVLESRSMTLVRRALAMTKYTLGSQLTVNLVSPAGVLSISNCSRLEPF